MHCHVFLSLMSQNIASKGIGESPDSDVASKKTKYDPFAELRMQLWIYVKRLAWPWV